MAASSQENITPDDVKSVKFDISSVIDEIVEQSLDEDSVECSISSYGLPGPSEPFDDSHESIDLDVNEQPVLIKQMEKLDTDKKDAQHRLRVLNKKLLDYFKRKQVLTAITTTKDAQITDMLHHKLKFIEKLNEYNELITKTKITKDQYEREIDAGEKENSELKAIYDLKWSELSQQFIEKGMVLKDSHTGKCLDQKRLYKMLRNLRIACEALAVERLQLIKLDEKWSTLEKRDVQLNDIGDGLTILDFNRLQRETEALNDKVQERCREIAKVRTQCFENAQTLAHVREKNSNLKSSVSKLIDSLAAAKIELNMNRHSLSKRKGKLNALRKRVAKVSDSCGLLEYPLLLEDYNQMVDSVQECECQIAALSNGVNQQTEGG